MPSRTACAERVFRCFKCLELAADAVTGAAGPLFIALAVVLFAVGAFCFCTPPHCSLIDPR